MKKHEIFCGAEETMLRIAARGARALHPRTMRWQVINKNARYWVKRTGDKLFGLFSDEDLWKQAKEKGLIL